jgi:pantoate--beta-alanine ligase
MRVLTSSQEWISYRDFESSPFGFVPTMGALHAGHESLVRASQNESGQKTVVSLFVNPTQFNNSEDFEKYPRAFEDDLGRCADWGVDAVFVPRPEDMYPLGQDTLIVPQDPLSQCLEGQFRPGHFAGVLTIVLKLFNLVRAKRAYFGEKDYQQAQLVRRLSKEFFVGTDVIVCPTVREGYLPLSSRNRRLSPSGLEQAHSLAMSMHQFQSATAIKQLFADQGIIYDYAEEMDGRLFAAWYVEGVRLLDNFALPSAMADMH